MLAVMLMIFFLSSQDDAASTGMSAPFVNAVISLSGVSPTGDTIGEAEVSAEEGAVDPGREYTGLGKTVETLVRKAGHICEFGILSFLVTLHVSLYRRRPWLWAVLFCAVYAAADETHQLFSAGRSAEIADVLIDIGGATTGAALYMLIKHIRGRESSCVRR